MVLLLAALATIAALATVAAAAGPCDITGAAGNPCVAAHSTTRALYAAYDGPLYKVTRSSDGSSVNVGVLQAGGFANIATHEAFCGLKDCVIANVFDQSPMGNHLGARHKMVNASQHKIFVGDGIAVYGMYIRSRLWVPRGRHQGHRQREQPRVDLRGHVRHARQREVLLRLSVLRISIEMAAFSVLFSIEKAAIFKEIRSTRSPPPPTLTA